MTAVEEFSIPDVEVKLYFDIPKTYCPFAKETCVGETCKFWWADDCIITKSLITYYNKEMNRHGHY